MQPITTYIIYRF